MRWRAERMAGGTLAGDGNGRRNEQWILEPLHHNVVIYDDVSLEK